MARTTFSGREVISVLTSFGYVPTSRTGRHVRPRYENPDTGEVRLGDVPMHSELKIGTVRLSPTSAVADDFEA